MKHLITYCSDKMTISAKLCLLSGLEVGGCNFGSCYTPHDIDENFKRNNKEILEAERGAGYWLWKPYFINEKMQSLSDGDILIYSDAGVQFINSIDHVLNVMDDDIFFFGNNYNHVDWCKADTLRATKCYTDLDTKQIQASVIIIKVNSKTKEFIKTWLSYCTFKPLIDDSPSLFFPNYPTFAEHRHDQAILTCLQINWGYKLHYWPASYNDGAFHYEKIEQYKDDNYPIIFLHHRRRNNEY